MCWCLWWHNDVDNDGKDDKCDDGGSDSDRQKARDGCETDVDDKDEGDSDEHKAGNYVDTYSDEEVDNNHDGNYHANDKELY